MSKEQSRSMSGCYSSPVEGNYNPACAIPSPNLVYLPEEIPPRSSRLTTSLRLSICIPLLDASLLLRLAGKHGICASNNRRTICRWLVERTMGAQRCNSIAGGDAPVVELSVKLVRVIAFKRVNLLSDRHKIVIACLVCLGTILKFLDPLMEKIVPVHKCLTGVLESGHIIAKARYVLSEAIVNEKGRETLLLLRVASTRTIGLFGRRFSGILGSGTKVGLLLELGLLVEGPHVHRRVRGCTELRNQRQINCVLASDTFLSNLLQNRGQFDLELIVRMLGHRIDQVAQGGIGWAVVLSVCGSHDCILYSQHSLVEGPGAKLANYQILQSWRRVIEACAELVKPGKILSAIRRSRSREPFNRQLTDREENNKRSQAVRTGCVEVRTQD